MSEKKILGVVLLLGLLLMSKKPAAAPEGDYVAPTIEPEPKKPADMPPSVSGRSFLKNYKTA